MTRATAAHYALLITVAATVVACDHTTGVYLSITNSQGIVADQVRVTAQMSIGEAVHLLPVGSGGPALKWPVTLLAELPDDAGETKFLVVALDKGATVGNASADAGQIRARHVVDVTAALTPGTLPIDDGGPPLDDMGESATHDLSSTAPPDMTAVPIVANAYSRTITVAKGGVSSADGASTLAGYPLLVSFTDPGLQAAPGGHVSKSDGSDLRFTASGATCGALASPCLLDYEIERYDANAGVLVAWVNVPALNTAAASNDTVITLYYGNPTPPGAPVASNTWDGHFRGVWHLASDATPTTTRDSTTNARTGTLTGTTIVPGNIGNALSFNGTGDYVEIADAASLEFGAGADFTISMWLKSSQQTGSARLLSKRDTSGGGQGYDVYLHDASSSSPWQAQTLSNSGNDSVNGRTNVADGNWHFITVVRAGTKLHAYEDGPEGTPTSLTASNDLTSSVPLRLGAAADATADQFYAGIEDEVRISGVARSIDWIMTDYDIQKPGSTTVTLGPEQAP